MTATSRLATGAILLLPGLLTVYLSFNAGGFFPDAQALVALVIVAILVMRIALADAPFGGYGRWLGLVAAALALYALWTLASGRWSDSQARALLEFDRALLYLLVLLLVGSLPHTAKGFAWMLRGVALAIVVVCVCGLITRTLPDVWPIAETVADERLGFPLTYWNALGLLASVGIILSVHFTSSRDEPPAVRVLAAAAVPPLSATLLFTFSRGAIAAGIAGLMIYLVLARPAAFVSGALAVVPTATIAVIAAYGADLLATADPTTPAAVDQGHEVAFVVALCTVAAALLRTLLLRLDPQLSLARVSPRARRIVPAAGAAASVIVLLAVGAPGYVGDQYDRFVEQGGSGAKPGDVRSRLTAVTNNGRIDTWDVAVDGFRDSPLHGEGAGTYQNVWAQERPITLSVQDAHSLYLEVLSELGLVGLALLLVVLIAIAVRLAGHARGPDRALYAAGFGAVIAWMIHAGVDWDWEMPAATLWVFALGGAVLARPPRPGGALAVPGTPMRLAAMAACIGLAVVPGLIFVSEDRLTTAADAFERGDCGEALDAAGSSIAALPGRPEPYEVRAYCRLRSGRLADGIDDLERAMDRDPRNWIYHYGLAVARGGAGLDPRPEARETLRLNPLDPEAQDLARRFRTDDRRAWRRQARPLLRGASPFYLSTR